MINPDFGVAIPDEELARCFKEIKPFFRCRERVRRDHLLALGHPRHMRIAIKGDTIRRERKKLLHAFCDPRLGLVRQAKEDIGIEAFHAMGTDHIDRATGGFKALDTTDGLLDFIVKILHANGGAVHPCGGERIKACAVDFIGIDFDGEFIIGRKRRNRGNLGGEIAHHIGAQERGRSTAPMQARKSDAFGKRLLEQGQLCFENLKIGAHGFFFLSALGPARTEPTEPAAERHVDI